MRKENLRTQDCKVETNTIYDMQNVFWYGIVIREECSPGDDNDEGRTGKTGGRPRSIQSSYKIQMHREKIRSYNNAYITNTPYKII